MTFVDLVLLYLFMSRLAILAAGIISVFLGYKLFREGIGASAGKSAGSNIESSIAGAKFSVKNAAPGTAFALFGAILIVVMLIQSSPSVTLETVSRWKAGDQSLSQATGDQTERL